MHVEDLSEPERALWDAFPLGTAVDLRTGDPELDDPAQGHCWGDERTIRAEVIRALLLGAREAEPGQAAEMRLHGARIVGPLDIPYVDIPYALRLRECLFEQPLDMYGVHTRQVGLDGSQIPLLIASTATIDGNLRLIGCRFTDQVRLVNTHVTGALLLDGACFTNSTRDVLIAQRLRVDADLLGRGGLTAAGGIELEGAQIGGRVDLSGARLTGEPALSAAGMTVGGSLWLRDGFMADGEVDLGSARIGSYFDCSGARLRNPSGIALRAGRVTVGGGLLLHSGFTADGRVNLSGAQVAGRISLSDANFRNDGDIAIDAIGLTVGGDLHSRGGLRTKGEVRLRGGRISGQLSLAGAQLTNPDGIALNCAQLTVDGDVLCLEGFSVEGEFNLNDAKVAGSVRLQGARLANPDGHALLAYGVRVGGVLDCRDGFAAYGRIRLNSSQAGSLNFRGARLVFPEGTALSCRRAQAGELVLETAEQIDGAVDLRHAQFGLLRDNPATWPDVISLVGLLYEAIEPRLTGGQRADWIRRDPDGYQPQPYEQLAAVYRRRGSDGDARRTLVAKERHRRAANRRWPAKVWGYVQDVTVGYGYQPMRALLWLLGLLVVGTVAFGLNQPIVAEPGKAAPVFNPLIYTLDLLLPIIDFGQERAYVARGGVQWLAYGLIAAGWVLATTLAAGAGRALRRQ